MSGKRGPSWAMLGPISGLGIRLMWSVMTIRSPTRNDGLMPPEAFDTKRYLMPICCITRTGKVTCCIV